ncbi:hypothetical protein SALB1_3358 [Salinisphaera sp. LB1]|nr:hypothetical protein SALB1_3358 [Salinisphaera sp. LB1]
MNDARMPAHGLSRLPRRHRAGVVAFRRQRPGDAGAMATMGRPATAARAASGARTLGDPIEPNALR